MAENMNLQYIGDSLVDIESKIDYAINQSVSSSTYKSFQANSASSNSLSFNVSTPSLDSVMDRRAKLQASMFFDVSVSGASTSQPTIKSFGYGADCFSLDQEGVCAFPLNSLFNSIKASLNDVSVSCEVGKVASELRHLYSQEWWSKNQTDTASYIDQDLVELDNYSTSPYSTNPQGTGQYPNEVVKTRGTCRLEVLNVVHTFNQPNDFLLVSGPATSGGDWSGVGKFGIPGESWTFTLKVSVVEDLMFLSPFTMKENEQGIMGVQNLSIDIQLKSDVSNIIKSCIEEQTEVVGDKEGTFQDYTNRVLTITPQNGQYGIFGNILPKLRLKFVSLHPEEYARLGAGKSVIPLTNITPYSSVQPTLAPEGTDSLSSLNISFNQVPEKILVCLKANAGDVGMGKQQYYAQITGVNIQFNNISGLLTDREPLELYQISKNNGSNLTWQEFQGSRLYTNQITKTTEEQQTIGSLLVLDPTKDFNLPSYLSAGVLGSYSFHIDVSVKNTGITAMNSPELLIIGMTSGLMITSQGQSQQVSGLLSKSDVIGVKESKMPDYNEAEVKEMEGGCYSCGVEKGKMMRKKSHQKGAGFSPAVSGGGLKKFVRK